MLMYDGLQGGGIFKLSSFVWWATANLSWGCHWWMRGRGWEGSQSGCWDLMTMGRADTWWGSGTRIVVPRHIHHMPGSGGSELSWGWGKECAKPGVICRSLMFGKWWIKRVNLATPDRIQHPAQLWSNKLYSWAQQKIASKESKVEDTDNERLLECWFSLSTFIKVYLLKISTVNEIMNRPNNFYWCFLLLSVANLETDFDPNKSGHSSQSESPGELLCFSTLLTARNLP